MESHIIQFRPNVPSEISGIQWLSMASPDTSVFVPFYTDINNTPEQYKIGTNKYDTNSAYWTYKETKTLADPYYNEYVKKYIRPVQRSTNHQLSIRLKADDQLARSTNDSEQLQQMLTRANQENANIAQNEFQKLNDLLIEVSTTKTPIVQNTDL
ncbi:dipeptidase [Lentilactobacillus kosonis]|uniref:Dipeptidase n=1 Tax=Lentilactobacillus kosonis TaxID=2810561 RepID=A0A401FJE2_9LACO|nr:dipeptidase [Lentilactobacillus kosonis]